MIGLSSTYYAVRGGSIYDSVKKTAELGFETIELGAAHAYEPGIFETLKKIRADFPGITFLVHALFPPQAQKLWFNSADGLTAQNKLIIDNLIAAAEVLGAGMFSLHAPIVNSVYMTENQVPGGFVRAMPGAAREIGAAQKGFFAVMDYIGARIKPLGLRVAIENMDNVYFRVLLDSHADYQAVFDRYPWAGLLLDVAHAKRSGNTRELAGLGARVLEVHLHENKDFSAEDTWGHFTIRDEEFFAPLKELLADGTLPLIFEHGTETSETELSSEKRLLENYMSKNLLSGVGSNV